MFIPLDFLSSNYAGQAGLEAAFQVPMPGDSSLSPNAGSISKLLLDPGDSGLLSFNKSETVLWTIHY